MTTPEEKPQETIQLTDFATQNPMIELAFEEYTCVFIKDISKIETLNDFKDYRYVYKLIVHYKDGKQTSWSWAAGSTQQAEDAKQKRNIAYQKVMNVIRACYPVLKV